MAHTGLGLRIAAWVVFLAVLALLPSILGDGYMLYTATFFLIWSAVVVSWDLIIGVAGIFSFGQVAFFAIGAYASAILSMRVGLSPWLSVVGGAAVAALAGLLIGLPCLRLKGIYVALVTFALFLAMPSFIFAGAKIGTGGAHSLTSIPGFTVFGTALSPMHMAAQYYVTLGLSLVVISAVYWVTHSNVGLAFRALRDAEGFAKSLGVNEYAHKLGVFAFSAGCAGLMGGFYGHLVGLISSNLVNLPLIVMLMAIMFSGGLGRFPGMIFTAALLVYLDELLRPFEAWRSVIWGMLVVLLVIFMPGGVMAGFERVGELAKSYWSGRHDGERNNRDPRRPEAPDGGPSATVES